MRKLGSLWRGMTVLVAYAALSTAAIGCGDDDTLDDQAEAGKGGSGGKAGSSGKGGSGGTPSAEQCVAETTTIFKGTPNGPPAECISCACTQAPGPVSACNAAAETCWGLIECVTLNCLDVPEAEILTCVGEKCRAFITGVSTATPLQDVLQSDTCSEECLPDTEDAGTPDAG